AGDAAHNGLTAEFAFGSDFASDARHFGSKCRKLVHHGVDGVLEFKNFALHVDRDLLGQVAAGDGGRHFGDVTNLVGEVVRHEVDVVGEIFPRAGDALHQCLAAKLSFGTDLAGDAGDFGGKCRKLIHHRVHDLGGSQKFTGQRTAFDFESHR